MMKLLKHVLLLLLVTFLLTGCVTTTGIANAHDSDRIDQLETKIHELNLRLSEVESLLNNPSTAQEVVRTSEGWKSVVNWRKLSRDMSYTDVRKILGEPQRIVGGYLEQWHYPNYGRVTFVDGNVDGWREPDN